QQTRDARLARRAAEIALNAKQTDEAMAAVRLWRELAPNSDEATQYYLGFIILGDDISEAQPILEQRLKDLRPGMRGAALLQLQRLMTRAKNRDASFKLLENISAPYDNLPEAHMALAQAAFTRNDSQRAVDEAQAALKLAPTSELAALTLAQVTPDKDAAARSLAQFIEKNPGARDVRLAYARMLVEQKNYDGARAEFKKLLADQPQDLTVLYALGLLGTQNSDWKEAETYLTQFVDLLAKHPEDERDPTQALMILAQIADERNDTAGALKWLGRVDEDVPQAYLNAQIRRAQIIAKAGDLPAGRKIIADFKADGQDEQTQLIMADAQLLRNAERTDEALAVLAAGLERFPDNTELLYDHAMAAEKLGKLEIMETSLRKIMKLAPENQNAYNALGYSLAERNLRLEEAYTLVQKALQLAPQDPFIMDSMGWVQFRLGRSKEAEALLRQAYALRPDPEIGIHLGEVLWANGQKDDARKLWRDANSKDPKNDTLKSTLARLQVTL
ncbi:MAG: tetratricopeptide repeat protein, partial [Janthinobacterium lividum]